LRLFVRIGLRRLSVGRHRAGIDILVVRLDVLLLFADVGVRSVGQCIRSGHDGVLPARRLERKGGRGLDRPAGPITVRSPQKTHAVDDRVAAAAFVRSAPSAKELRASRANRLSMDRPSHSTHSIRTPRMGGTPQIECPECSLPVLLTFVERDGNHRSLTCPYCDRRDEWTIDVRS